MFGQKETTAEIAIENKSASSNRVHPSMDRVYTPLPTTTDVCILCVLTKATACTFVTYKLGIQTHLCDLLRICCTSSYKCSLGYSLLWTCSIAATRRHSFYHVTKDVIIVIQETQLSLTNRATRL